MEIKQQDIVFLIIAALFTLIILFYPAMSRSETPEPKIDLSEPVTTSTTVFIP